MTCIIGLQTKDCVYIGGDSAGVSDLSIWIRKDEKVFKNQSFIMGFTTSFRMGQLLRFKFKPPKNKYNDDYEYMVTDFIDAVKKCFDDNDFGSKGKGGSEGGQFLVGYKGNLYEISDDYQVAMTYLPFNAVGCGAQIALGSLYTTQSLSAPMDPEERINMALNAAAQFSAGVSAPFIIIKQKKKK